MKKILALLLSLVTTFSFAFGYSPEITFIFSSGPASGSRSVIDIYSQCFTEHGLTSVYDFRSGAQGLIGVDALINFGTGKSTLPVLVGGTGVNMYSAFTTVDVLTDIVPVAFLTTEDLVIVTKADGPIKSLADIIALSKQRPITVGTATVTSDWVMNHFFKEIGVPYTPIPYPSNSRAHTDVMGGFIDMEADLFTGAKELISSGRFAVVSGTFSRAESFRMKAFTFSPILSTHTGGIILNLRTDATPEFTKRIIDISINCGADRVVGDRLRLIGSRPRVPMLVGSELRAYIKEVRSEK